MKALYKFYCKCTFESKLLILRTFLELPAVVYHEFCHLIMAVLFSKKINYFKCCYFYKVSFGTLYTYKFELNHQIRNNTNIVLVSIAPLIGIIISPFISWYLFIYLIFSYKTSLLSSQDYNNIKGITKNKKISVLLNNIERIIVPIKDK